MLASKSKLTKSLLSNRKRKLEEDPTTLPSTTALFFASYRPQSFSLPASIIYYIAKNPSSPEMYEKMSKTCKYFFVTNPILIVPRLNNEIDGWYCGKYLFDLTKLTSKLWITDAMHTSLVIHVKHNIFSDLFPKVYRFDAKRLNISNQIISYTDISLLVPSAEQIFFMNVTVKEDNSIVAIEKIVKLAVKAIMFYCNYTPAGNVTCKTMKELTKIRHFSSFDRFIVHEIPEDFDLESFYAYMKKNKHTRFCLYFANSIYDAYKNRLAAIIDEILVTKDVDYVIPLLYYRDIDREKYRKTEQMYRATLSKT